MIKILTFIALLSCFTIFCEAQKIATPNTDLLINKWEAKWIAPPHVTLVNYGVFHFRKSFNLTSIYQKDYKVNWCGMEK